MTILSKKNKVLLIKLSILVFASAVSLQSHARNSVDISDSDSKRGAVTRAAEFNNAHNIKLSADKLEDIANSCAAQGLSDAAPGLVIAIVKDNQIAVERGYGSKRSEIYDPVDTQTLFRPGSTQKMMTAAAVLVQQEKKNLSLPDSIQGLVSEAEFNSLPLFEQNEISIHNLLSHTSGIPDQTILQCDDDFTLSHWVAGLTNTHTMAPANTFYNYSNAGFMMAGLVAERAAGTSYAQLMKSTIWGPSNMNSTFATLEEAMTYTNQSYGHTSVTGEFLSLPMDAYSCSASSPSGLGFTTIGDMARWTMMLMNRGGETLSHESVKHMISRQVEKFDSFVGRYYGYGVDIQNLLDANSDRPNAKLHPAIEHGGNIPGWSAHTIMLPHAEFSISVMNNGDVGSSDVAYCILENTGVINDALLPEPILTGADDWKQYQGGYLLRHSSGEILPAFVYLDNEVLHVVRMVSDSDDWIDSEAIQVNGGHFILVDLDSGEGTEITFIKDENTKRDIWMRNRDFVGKRSLRYW